MSGINRYTTVNWNQPMSSYTPLPLDHLMKVGATMQKNYDEGIAETYQLQDVMKTLPVIYDPSLGLDNRQALKDIDASYGNRLNEITDKIVKQGDMSAKQELRRIARDFENDPRVRELRESRKNYDAYVKDITTKGTKYNPLLDDYRNAQLYNEKGLQAFRYHGMEDSLDAPKRFKEIMGDLAKTYIESGRAVLTPEGLKVTNKGKREGVSDEQLQNISNQKVGLAINTDEGKQFMKILKRTNPNLTNDELIREVRNALYNSAIEQVGISKSSYYEEDPTQLMMYNLKKGDAKKEAVKQMIGSTEESKTDNAIALDTNFKGLFDTGVFKFDNVEQRVKFNPSSVYKQAEDYGISIGANGVYDVSNVKSVTAKKNLENFNKQIIKMSKAVGVDPKSLSINGKLNNQRIEELASAYNSLSKFRTLDLNLTKAASKIEGESATRNWDNISIINPETGKPLDKKGYEVLEGDVVVPTVRRNINGKTYIEGKINKKDGTSIPVLYRPNTVEKNKVFDGLAQLQEISINNLSKDKPDYYGDFNVPGLNLGNANYKIEGKSAIGQGRYVMSIVDPNNKLNNKYVLTNDKNQILDIKNSLGDMKKVVEQHYYTNIPEGETELTELLNNNSLYKEYAD